MKEYTKPEIEYVEFTTESITNTGTEEVSYNDGNL